jgi:hypothetical protein
MEPAGRKHHKPRLSFEQQYGVREREDAHRTRIDGNRSRACRGKHAGVHPIRGRWLTFLRMPGVDRQGQAHIVSTAIRLPRSCKGSREVEATPWLRTRFSIDPQPASISPTINISIVFICAFPLDCGQIICRSATKNDSNAILRSVLLASSTG